MRRAHRWIAFSLALVVPATLAAGPPTDYAIDPVHTRALVAVDHAGFSRALGTVSGATGRLAFGEDWTGAQVDVRIPLDRLDFGDPRWNAAVRDILGTARHPQARFVSTRVTPSDATHAEVCGDLTLHGATRPLCLQATFNAARRHPMPPFRRTVGFSATGSLPRSGFGIERWANLIGDTVELRIEVEASRGIGAPDADAPVSPEEP